MRFSNLVLILVISALALTVSGTDIPGKNPNDLTVQIDHIVIGISELEKGIEQSKRKGTVLG